ncbi:heterokaryon incompatibility protein-domain-containing protein [Bombardia bombarda]|uniref:Heterokaryon incompatibility protein-domain-containing protein n=1 Tax=Bombardia bombarda TaxID=252184 RepID=A0AA39WBP3_9PEZI|nr:heterokaryon incompatibility protein-domain-containing protein [Bombardia bombarda]
MKIDGDGGEKMGIHGPECVVSDPSALQDNISGPGGMSEYQYLPLENSEDSQRAIRLLHLMRGEWDSTICCSLQHASIDDGAEYEALSYTWGDVNDCRQITVDGATLNITANLEVALRHLRYQDKPRVLWVDAVCINQFDDQEKGFQIRTMYDIFFNATKVLAWTGEAGEDGMCALNVIAYISHTMGPWDVLEMNDFTGFVGDECECQFGYLKPHCWDHLWKFLDRPYWTRLWVVQELRAGIEKSKANKWTTEQHAGKLSGVLVGCGDVWRPANDLWRTCVWLWDNQTISGSNEKWISWYSEEIVQVPLGPPAAAASMIMASGFLKSWFSSSEHPALLLARTSKMAASDPRDKVYGLLGLFGTEYMRDITPDYSPGSEERLLNNLTRLLVQKGRSLTIIYGNRSHPQYRKFRSTWTPDLYNIPNYDENDRVLHTMSYIAGGVALPVACLDEQTNFLHVKGVRVGRALTPHGPFEESLYSILLELDGIIRQWNDGSELSEHFQKMWKTIMRSRHAPAEHQRITNLLLASTGLIKAYHKRDGDSEPHDDNFVYAEVERMEMQIIEMETLEKRALWPTQEQHGRRFLAKLLASLGGRCICMTDSGHCVIGPFGMREGDVVVTFVGGKVPFVLRESEENPGMFELVGDAYVSDIMDGELFEGKVVKDMELEIFGLV